MRIFGKVALNAHALFLEGLAQDLQLGDEPVDVLHRGTGHALNSVTTLPATSSLLVSGARRRLAPSCRTNSQISASTAASMDRSKSAGVPVESVVIALPPGLPLQLLLPVDMPLRDA